MHSLAELKKAIIQETKKIWVDEPDDVKAIRHGFFPSGAGVYDQYFSVLVMLGSETRNLSIHTFSSLIDFSRSDKFDLDQLKYMTGEMLRVTNGVLAYFGLKKLGEIISSFISLLEDIQDKNEYETLVEDLFTLSNRYQMWLYQTFPWHLSVFFPKNDKGKVEENQAVLKNLNVSDF